MATKVKPTRLNITGTPQPWNVPVYVDADNFQWWAGWGGWASFWRFLSLWDCATWQPISFPESTPYLYLTWDYYMVNVVSAATPPVNYRPDWNSYTGTASSVVELDEVEVWDTYVYDWTTWLLQSNHGKTVTFANIAWDPYDNTNLDSALDAKQDLLVSWTNIKTVNNNSLVWSGNVSVWDMKYTDYNWTTLTWNSVTLALNSQIAPAANFTINAPWTIKDWQEYILRVTSGWTVYAITLGTNMSNPSSVDTTLTANSVDQFVFLAVWWQLELQPRDKDTTYTASTWISISAQNEISNTWVLSFNGSTWTVTYTAPVTSVNTQTWAVTVNDIKVAAAAPASPTEWMTWYDTTNDKLKSYDWANWNVVWDGDVTWPASSTDWHLAVFDGVTGKLIKDWWAVPVQNVKIFTLSSTSDLVNAQAAYDWYVGGWVPIIKSNDATYAWYYYLNYMDSSLWIFRNMSTQTSQYLFNDRSLKLTISSWSVTALTFFQSQIQKVSSLPASPVANVVYLVTN